MSGPSPRTPPFPSSPRSYVHRCHLTQDPLSEQVTLHPAISPGENRNPREATGLDPTGHGRRGWGAHRKLVALGGRSGAEGPRPTVPRGPRPPLKVAIHPLPSRTAVMVSVPTVVPLSLLLWGLSCAKGAFLCLSGAPAPRTPAPQRGLVPEQPLVSDRQVIRLQVRGRASLVPSSRACHPGPTTTPLSWCPGCLPGILAWGLWATPAPGRCFSPPRPSRGPCLPEGQERSPGPHLLWLPWRLQPAGTGGRGCRGPLPPRGMEPPAAACHVVQHVTAVPCCLELSQAKAVAEQAPGGAGRGPSLTALSRDPGPERGSHWSKATQPIRGSPREALVGRRVLEDPEGTLLGQGSPCRDPQPPAL